MSPEDIAHQAEAYTEQFVPVEPAPDIEDSRIWETLRKPVVYGTAVGGCAIALFAGKEMAADTPVAYGQTCTTEQSADTTTKTCVFPDGSTTTEVTSTWGGDATTQGSSDSSDQPPAPEEAEATPEEPPAAETRPASTERSGRRERRERRKKIYSYEMADSPLTDGNGCFSVAFAIAGSTARQKAIKPTAVAKSKHLSPYWTPQTGVKNGGGLWNALPGLSKQYGLESKRVGAKQALRTIKKGGAVIVLAKYGHFAGPSGHYFAAVDVKGNRMIMKDGNGKGKNGDTERKKGWTLTELRERGVISYFAVKMKKR